MRRRPGSGRSRLAALFVRHGDTRGTALSQGTLGIAAYRSGEFDAAGRLLTDSLQTLRSVGDRRGSALMLEALAKLNYAQGGYRRAAELAADSLELDRSSGERRGVATALLLLSGVAVQEARFSVAAKLLGAVERLVKEVGFTLSAPDRAMFDDLKAALERGMQADSASARVERGRRHALRRTAGAGPRIRPAGQGAAGIPARRHEAVSVWRVGTNQTVSGAGV